MTDKEAQLKAKLLKMKLAEQKKWSATGLSPEEVQKVRADHEKRRKYMKLDPTKNKNKVTESDFQSGNFEIKDAKSKVNKLKKKYVDPNPQAETPEEIMQSAESAGREPSYIAQEHGHRISFRGHSAGNYKTASLNEQSGKYAKYWLLNAKDTNGNGWGIAAHTAKDNMKKFIGRPLVVTASSWHGASEYGDQYEHPYLPTNDITAILDHQEKFRVGSIVDVVEDSHGDWYANVEMLPKFANSRLPPFCSPAIYQLDASEAEGQISKWEALHLAALTENPAYGARIALLKGTCVGTGSECKVQFKVAKQQIALNPPPNTRKQRQFPGDDVPDNVSCPGCSSTNINMWQFDNKVHKCRNCGNSFENKDIERDIHELDESSKYATTVCPKKKQKISRLKQRLSASGMPDDFAKDPDPFPKNKKLDFNDRENGRGGRQLKIFKKGDSGGMFDRTKGPLEKEVPFGKVKGKNKNLSGQPVSQTPADIQRENKKTDKYLDKGTKIRPLKPTQADRRKIITAKEEDPTEKVIREVKDPEKKKDLLNRLDEKPNEYGPKNYGATKPKNFGKKIGKLKQKLASPIIQETGEGITFKKVDPKIYDKKTYGYHKVPMHPSNTILIRPKDPEKYMDLVDHFRKIHETHDFAKYTQGSVQQNIPLRSLRNDIRHMSGDPLKRHADISTASGKAFKKGDILMRRVGGTPKKGKYGTVGETYYIEEDSPEGEIFNAPSKYNRRAKLKARLAVTASKKIPTSKVEGFAPLPNKRGDVSEFAKSLRTKKRDIYDELAGHPKGKTAPYNIVKRPNRYTHKEEYEKGKKQFEDHIHRENNRPEETMIYMKKHGIHDNFEKRKVLSISERKKQELGTGFDHPNIAGYTAENAVRWSKLKTRLANLGEQNMTYQDSKKVKIHKKKNMEKHDKS